MLLLRTTMILMGCFWVGVCVIQLELLKNREGVWRTLGTAKMSWDVVNSSTHQLRVLGSGGGDVFTQENTVFAPPELSGAVAS